MSRPFPVRYSGLMPPTPQDFCKARVLLISYYKVACDTGSVVTRIGSPKEFLDLESHEAKRFLANFAQHVAADRNSEVIPQVRPDLAGGFLQRPDLMSRAAGFSELGALRQFFADEVMAEEGEGDSNSSWVADAVKMPDQGMIEMLIRNPDAGQMIRCAVDERKCLGMLALTDGDLSLGFYVSPHEVAQAGLAFYSGLQGLAHYIGLPTRQFEVKQKPIAKWMQVALKKLEKDMFAGNTDFEFSPVDWSRETDVRGRDGVIVSGAIMVTGKKETGILDVPQVVLCMSLIKSGATRVFDEADGRRRVEVMRDRPQPRLFVEILRPRSLLFDNRLTFSGHASDWVNQVWLGQT